MESFSSPDPPFDGDPGWRVQRRLPEGTEITLRPLGPDDREALRAAFRETSARTRYLRFLGGLGEPSEATLTYLTNVDQSNHVAIAATLVSPDLKTERGIGVARFIRVPGKPHVAEAAITVVDDMQRRGVGTVLAHELERAARALGVRSLRADVLADNETMRSILQAAGATPVADDRASGTLTYDIELEPPPNSRGLLDVLRGAAETMAVTIRNLGGTDKD